MGKAEVTPFLGLLLEKPAMLFPVTALMPGRKQYDNIFFFKKASEFGF